jgi:hypothetical protein
MLSGKQVAAWRTLKDSVDKFQLMGGIANTLLEVAALAAGVEWEDDARRT